MSGYYAVIPATVRYDKRLPALARMLYGELTALADKKGYCWAGNKYFSDLYGVSIKTISRWISALEECGYITVTIDEQQGNNRTICIGKPSKKELPIIPKTAKLPMDKNVHTYGQKCPEGIDKNVHTYRQKCPDPKYCINNTSINTNERTNERNNKINNSAFEDGRSEDNLISKLKNKAESENLHNQLTKSITNQQTKNNQDFLKIWNQFAQENNLRQYAFHTSCITNGFINWENLSRENKIPFDILKFCDSIKNSNFLLKKVQGGRGVDLEWFFKDIDRLIRLFSGRYSDSPEQTEELKANKITEITEFVDDIDNAAKKQLDYDSLQKKLHKKYNGLTESISQAEYQQMLDCRGTFSLVKKIDIFRARLIKSNNEAAV